MKYWSGIFKIKGQVVISFLDDNGKMIKPLSLIDNYFINVLNSTDIAVCKVSILGSNQNPMTLEDYFEYEPKDIIFDIDFLRKYEIYNIVKDNDTSETKIMVSEVRDRKEDDIDNLTDFFLSGDMPLILTNLIKKTQNEKN